MAKNSLTEWGRKAIGKGWKAAVSKALGVNLRTVERWASGSIPLPEWVVPELTRRFDFLASEKWLLLCKAVGTSRADRTYILHKQRPSFIARVVEVDDDGVPMPHERDVNVSGFTFDAGQDVVLAEFFWFSEPPTGKALMALLKEAAAAAMGCPKKRI